MGVIRTSLTPVEQLDVLQNSLGILQGIANVLNDPKALEAVRTEFTTSIKLCFDEIKVHEQALKDIQYAKTKTEELTAHHQKVVDELNDHHKKTTDDINEKTAALEKTRASLDDFKKELEALHVQTNEENMAMLTRKNELNVFADTLKKRDENMTIRETAHTNAVNELNKRHGELTEKHNDISVREDAVTYREDVVIARERKLREI